LSDGQACRLAVEDDGWVNWSGLATLLANIEKAFAEKLDRIFPQSLSSSTS